MIDPEDENLRQWRSLIDETHDPLIEHEEIRGQTLVAWCVMALAIGAVVVIAYFAFPI